MPSTVYSFPIAAAQAYELIYGAAPSADALALMAARGRSDPVASLSDLRRLIMALDRGQHRTPAVIRFEAHDLARVPLDGFRMVVDVADLAVSAHIVATRMWEPALTGVFRRCLRPGDRVADIGANVGYYSMLARSLVGPQGTVFAFEPNSENCRLILLSIAENEFENITLFPLALSDAVGHVYFTSGLGSNGRIFGGKETDLTSATGVVVPTMRLDDLIAGPLNFVKIDAEGSEYRIVRGAERMIASCRPIVSTEFSCEMLVRASEVDPRDYLGFFTSLGYTLNRLDMQTGALHRVPDVDRYLADWADPSRVDDLLMLPTAMPWLQG